MSTTNFNFVSSTHTLTAFHAADTLFSKPGYAKCNSHIITNLLGLAHSHMVSGLVAASLSSKADVLHHQLEFIYYFADGVKETDCNLHVC